MGGAVGVAREPRVLGHLRDAEDFAQLAELAVVGGRHDEVVVGGGQRLVGEDAGVGVAHAVGHGVAGDVGRAVVDQSGEGRGQQVHLDELARPRGVAVAECGEDADRGVVAGHHVEHGYPGPVGRPVRVSRQAHEARDGLHHEVVAGDVPAGSGAEAGDRRVDQPGVVLPDRVVVQSVLRHAAGLEVLDQDVRPAGEAPGDLGVVRVPQVERDRTLPPVDPEVVGRDLVACRGHPGAGVVAGRSLDLHDVGPQVGEQHRGVRPGKDP